MNRLASAEELQDIADAPVVPAARVTATPFRWREPDTIPPRQFLFGRHAVRKFVSATVAPGGTGKTNNEMAECAALVTGNDFLTAQMQGSCRAWYLGLEDPLEEYQRRLAGIVLHHRLPIGVLEGGLFLDSGRLQDFVIAREARNGVAIVEPIVASIISNIRANDIAFLAVDPFIASHTVRENDNGMIEQVVRAWARIADETGCAVDLVHHVRKGTTGQEPTADDARGARALVDKARSVRVLTAMSKEEALQAGVDERRRFFKIANGAKANLGLPPEETTWRQMVSVSLGNGNGGPDDHVGVVAVWKWPNPFDDVTVADLDAVQVKIATGEWRADVQAKAWAGNAVADVLGLDITDPKVKSAVKSMLATWIKNGALKIEPRYDAKRRDHRNIIIVGKTT